MSIHGPIATHRTATGIPTGRLAVWWLMASEIFIFGGLIMCFILFKLNGAPGFEDASLTSTVAGAFNTFVLLSSSFTAVLAHQAAERGDGKTAAKFLLFTIGGAVSFLGIKSYEWWYEISHGYTITSNGFWAFYYTAAGLHALHVIAGAIIMGIVAFDAWRNLELQRVELIGIYWHFVDVVWIFLFPLLYIAK